MQILYDKDLQKAIEKAKTEVLKFPIPHQVYFSRGAFKVLPIDTFEEIEFDEVPICLILPPSSE
jgi:hypothetical protein